MPVGTIKGPLSILYQILEDPSNRRAGGAALDISRLLWPPASSRRRSVDLETSRKPPDSRPTQGASRMSTETSQPSKATSAATAAAKRAGCRLLKNAAAQQVTAAMPPNSCMTSAAHCGLSVSRGGMENQIPATSGGPTRAAIIKAARLYFMVAITSAFRVDFDHTTFPPSPSPHPRC